MPIFLQFLIRLYLTFIISLIIGLSSLKPTGPPTQLTPSHFYPLPPPLLIALPLHLSSFAWFFFISLYFFWFTALFFHFFILPQPLFFFSSSASLLLMGSLRYANLPLILLIAVFPGNLKSKLQKPKGAREVTHTSTVTPSLSCLGLNVPFFLLSKVKSFRCV